MKPRIYTYKITFPHQKWWYWGVHKEEKHGETYDGSPTTHSEKWKNFEFEKQILEFFDDWDVARSVEKRLIGPDLNNPLCLNENSGGGFSLEASRKGGKIAGRISVESGHLQSISSKGGKITNSQKWRCLVTGYISSPGPLTCYQRARGIDTNQRILIND